MYNSEEEFLKNYNPSKYPRFSVSTDIIILGVTTEKQNNYRKLNDKYFSVLLVKRKNYPYKDMWCLPGGFVKEDEDIKDAPIRILKDEAGLDDIYLEQLYTYGSVNRDPRMRVVATSYMALVDKSKYDASINQNASWFKVSRFDEDNLTTIILDNDIETIKFVIEKTLIEKTTDRYSFKIKENDGLAFDHPLIVLSALERLKGKVAYTDIVFNMMPEYFTLGELQQVYELILGKKLLDPAFRRIIADKVIKTEKMRTDGGHRPSILFKYNKQ